jgi:pimeloyl-ACP methyl ester carboxylesterase
MPAHDIPMPRVPGVTHRFVEIDGLRVHLAEAGTGPALLLLHGWPQHWWCWRHVIPLLEGFRLIMPDMRGFGWSSVPTGGYDKERLATDVLRIMDAEQIDRAGIIGHDWGGWVGFLACLREPNRFEGLLALGITHPFTTPSIRAIMQSWRLGYQPIIGAPLLGPTLLSRSSCGFARMLSHAGVGTYGEARRYTDVIAQPARAAASADLYRTFLVRELAGLGRYRRRVLGVPTRLMVGTDDPVIAPAFLEGWQPFATDMSVEMITGVGHFLPEQAPGAVAAAAMRLFDPLADAATAAGGTLLGRTPEGALVEGPNSA